MLLDGQTKKTQTYFTAGSYEIPQCCTKMTVPAQQIPIKDRSSGRPNPNKAMQEREKMQDLHQTSPTNLNTQNTQCNNTGHNIF